MVAAGKKITYRQFTEDHITAGAPADANRIMTWPKQDWPELAGKEPEKIDLPKRTVLLCMEVHGSQGAEFVNHRMFKVRGRCSLRG